MIKSLFNFFPFVNNNLYSDLSTNRTRQDNLRILLLTYNSNIPRSP